MDPVPWLCAGDFNEIISLTEKYGGSVRANGQMEAFRNTLTDCALADLGCSGPKFTWNNGMEGNGFIQERLDRVVANAEWCELNPEVGIYTEATIISDHNPILIKLQDLGLSRKKKNIIRYEESWAKERGSKEVIKQVWREKIFYGDKWQHTKHKLNKCSHGLLSWKRKVLGATEEKILKNTEQLRQLQGVEGTAVMSEIKLLQKELHASLEGEGEELKWKPRSKEAWLKEGDRNTKYFHACAN